MGGGSAHYGDQVLLITLDLLGIFAFALTGALVALRKDLDVFGLLVLAGATGLGGGFVRDVLIGATPPAALADWRYLLVPVVTGLAVALWHPVFTRMERVIGVLDAFGLALFCVTGTVKALAYGLGPLPAAMLGMVTAVGGGIVRDLLAGRVPVVLQKDLYAIPAFVGAMIVVGAYELRDLGWDLPNPAVAGVAMTVCLGWRLLAMRRGWSAPRPGGSSSSV